MAPGKTSHRESANLTQELNQREAELALINSVQEGLVTNLDFNSIIHLVGGKLGEIFNVSAIQINIYDRTQNLMHIPYCFEEGNLHTHEDVDIHAPHWFISTMKEIIETRRAVVINENTQEFARQRGGPTTPPKGAKWSLSMAGVPLISKDEATGILWLMDNDRENVFSESMVRLLQTLANSMSVALENARSFAETQQRNSELAIINSVQEGLASRLDIQEIYELVGNKIREVFSADVIGISIYDFPRGMIEIPYILDHGEKFVHPARPIYGTYQYMMDYKKPLSFHTLEEGNQFRQEVGQDNLGGPTPDNSHMIVPILAGDHLLGTVTVGKLEENAFNEQNLQLLQTLANSMSVALENARLFSETQRLLKEKERRNTELGIINSVQEGLASKLEFHEILELVGTKIREVFNADVIGIAIYDLSKGVIELPYMLDHGERFDGLNRPIYGTAQYLLNNSKPLLFKHIREIRQFMEEVGQDNIGGSTQDNSHMIVPILTGDHLIGIVDVGTLAEQAFNEQDLQLLQTLANSMSVALENAKLWEQEKLFRKALQRELDIGREIQAGFLPLELPRLEGWEIAASLMSAREVAGDFYDVFELPDGNIGLVIADVCDKGVGAALFMTLFRSLVRAAANLDHYENIQQESQPHSTRERLKLSMSLTNDYIAETHGESGMFATLFFGILDPRTGMLAYVNGGHEPPLVTHEGTVRRRLEKTGPAVGVLEKIEFQIAEVELQSGDVFFAFTDGLPDCQNPKGEFFGQERLNALLPKKASADEFVHIFETDLHQYVAGATQFDDITMLAVRRLPSAQ